MLALTLLSLGCASSSQSAIAINIDPNHVTGAISPLIYGDNSIDFSGRGRFLTFGRQGGNRMTAYNWENNASNAGNDYRFQNDAYLGGGDTPGEVVRLAVDKALGNGKAFLVTVPMADYVSADKKGDGDVRQSPDHLRTRFKKNLPRKKAKFAYPPDTSDDAVYQDEFVWWLERAFPKRKAPIFYSLDNEPDLWASTHNEIHPDKLTYAELVRRTKDWSSAIKDIAPKSLVFGPVNYGWNGMVTLQGAPDAAGRDFLDFYLQSMHDLDREQGRRLVDVLDVHYYSEARAGGKRVTDKDSSDAVEAGRIEATRSLWDPNYTEDSWITSASTHGPIRLIPRLKEKIAKFYPGTKLALTEYNFGGNNDISGAIAEADALGVFGREGVFAAALWPDDPQDYALAALDLFTNYDGRGTGFGDRELAASSASPEVSVYAAKASVGKQRTTVVLVNHSTLTRTVKISLDGALKHAKRFELTKVAPQVRSMGDVNDSLLDLPARSATVLETDH